VIFERLFFTLALAPRLELAKDLLARAVRLRTLTSITDLRLKLFQIRCDCLVYLPSSLRLLGSLDDAVFDCLEDRLLALCRRNGVRWPWSALLPSQGGVVERNDVVAFRVMLRYP
jgi:hypothetical protein